MACRKMNEDVAYARNTESGCNIDSSSSHNIDTVPFSLIRGVRSLSLLSFPYSEHGISGILDGVLQASFVTNSKFATQRLLDTETSTNWGDP